MKKLNIGCGEFKKVGYVNVDYYSVSKPDVVHDLNIVPYPFEDDEFILAEADHVIEHLENPFKVIKELHRIVSKNGLIKIKVPHFSRGFTHPEHKRGFDVTLPYYFSKTFVGGFQGIELKCTKIKLNWFAQHYLKKNVLSKSIYIISLITGMILNMIANLSPTICSRLWCFWVGGFEEIEFEFIVIK
ncbi:methyltransferase domain protein [Leptospira interrogans str. 2003000735]|uniref:Methyltransferase domain protein n=4 Tax=Leptospira interrogans TaxID=173 RepID=A0A829D1M0_LEPIR|nr:methyltransferase domain-containing protein [Leptospira interrogans]EMF40967.1 methyltransferase domain protein [Leptospira interrogans serovar Lora str. TE 1992]EMY02628.1 methyltransferase domain protein [Leptospira interrogans str. 2002000626]EMY27424.1 methyltransferase domain protein [Leptospira interrogans serovar Australis str. 200703203]AKH77646.1 methyltransferase type 11 [Leptospira interrogans serovar Bratislava]EKN90337.1 methyltransferase domain protein [Leptospira interrogans 